MPVGREEIRRRRLAADTARKGNREVATFMSGFGKGPTPTLPDPQSEILRRFREEEPSPKPATRPFARKATLGLFPAKPSPGQIRQETRASGMRALDVGQRSTEAAKELGGRPELSEAYGVLPPERRDPAQFFQEMTGGPGASRTLRRMGGQDIPGGTLEKAFDVLDLMTLPVGGALVSKPIKAGVKGIAKLVGKGAVKGAAAVGKGLKGRKIAKMGPEAVEAARKAEEAYRAARVVSSTPRMGPTPPLDFVGQKPDTFPLPPQLSELEPPGPALQPPQGPGPVKPKGEHQKGTEFYGPAQKQAKPAEPGPSLYEPGLGVKPEPSTPILEERAPWETKLIPRIPGKGGRLGQAGKKPAAAPAEPVAPPAPGGEGILDLGGGRQAKFEKGFWFTREPESGWARMRDWVRVTDPKYVKELHAQFPHVSPAGGRFGQAGKIRPETMIRLGGVATGGAGYGMQGSEDPEVRFAGKALMAVGGAALISPSGWKQVYKDVVRPGERAAWKAAANLSKDLPEIQDLRKAIRKSQRINVDYEKIKAEVYSQRTARLHDIYEDLRVADPDLVEEAHKVLSGRIPKPTFTALDLSDTVKDRYRQMVRTTDLIPKEDILERHVVQEALEDIFDGVVPPPGALKKVRKIFGLGVVRDVLEKSHWYEAAGRTLVDIANIPRTVLAMADVSAWFRQGALLVSEPVSFAKAMGRSLKVMFDEDAYQVLDQEIKAHPLYGRLKKAKVYLAPTEMGGALAEREETFISNLASRIPFARASERAYNGFLNKLRSDVFYNYAGKWGGDSKEELRVLADAINAFTGRGSLWRLNAVGAELATVFFSPRFLASRLQVPLQLLRPGAWKNPRAGAFVAKKLAASTGLAFTMLALAKESGAEVETDYRSSDFGRIKIGDTRIDILGGMQPLIRATAQVLTGERKSLRTGKRKSVSPLEVLGTGRSNFLRSKLSPPAGAIWTLGTRTKLKDGRTVYYPFAGKEFEATMGDLPDVILRELAPMTAEDLYSAWKEEGPWIGGLAGAAAATGFGVSTFEPYEEKPKARRRKKHIGE